LFPIRDVNPTRIRPLVTITIIAVNLAVFFLWQPQGDELAATSFAYERAAIACEMTTGEPLSEAEIVADECIEGGEAFFPGKRVFLAGLVSMFLHGGIFHLLSNMWFLWVFGNNVEEAFGSLPYLLFYLVGGVAATAAFVLSNPESTIPLVGASGAIAAVLGAYLVLFPTHRVLTWIVIIFAPVPAVVFLGIWFFSQFGLPLEGVAWEAHVGGFIAGVLITLPLRSVLLRNVRQLHAPGRIFGSA
jgi:membrane associated rhomboid family serine protease